MITIVALALLATATQPAGPPSPSAPSAASGKVHANTDGDKVVCRRETQVGSLFSQSICHTKSEWQAMANDARDDTASAQLGSMHSRANQGIGSGH